MTLETIISLIDSEIARLQNVRDLLAEVTTKSGDNPAPRKRRKISPAGRRNIAAAQRKRWAKQKGK